jgi:transposase
MVQCQKNVKYSLNQPKCKNSQKDQSQKPHKTKRKKTNRKRLTNLDRINPDAAGIDVASTEHWVCVPPERTQDNVRKFGTFTCDLKAISQWLKSHKVKTVAMESTGIYWIPLFQRLEQDGFEVLLVNARHVKNVPGRTKSDNMDCQWVQKLHTFGLLQGSFRPNDQVCKLRSFLRHRDNLIAMAAKHTQHMQKALWQMNILLTNVLSDITGATGLRIINAILTGQRDPILLAKFKDSRIKASLKTIAKALEGDYRDEQLFILEQSLDMYRYTHQLMERCDQQVQDILDQWDKVTNSEIDPLPPSTSCHVKPRDNEPTYDIRNYLYEILGVDLTQIPGLQASSIQTILAEVGTDMTKWLSEKHFSSWLGLCPAPDISGGKILKNKTNKVQSRAAKALRLAARACANSSSAIGAFYRRMRYRIGPSKAITATAHKLAVIFYIMVRDKVNFIELGVEYYERQHQERMKRNLERKAKSLGLKLIPIDESETPAELQTQNKATCVSSS